jgi:hypothetical protein
VSHAIDLFENVLQHLLKIKRWDTATHSKYVTAAVKRKTVAATAKMDVALECLSRSEVRVARFGGPPCLSLFC